MGQIYKILLWDILIGRVVIIVMIFHDHMVLSLPLSTFPLKGLLNFRVKLEFKLFTITHKLVHVLFIERP